MSYLNSRFNGRAFAGRRKGAAAILVIFMFVAMLLLGFVTIKVSNVQRHMVSAQIASDSATRWGVDGLSRADDANARQQVENEVRELARKNYSASLNGGNDNGSVAKSSVDVDVVFGNARPVGDSFKFEPNKIPYNSARVVVGAEVNNIGPLAGMDDKVKVERGSTSMALERDLCLVIDRSGSMLWDKDRNGWMYDTSYHSYNKMSTSSNYRMRRYSYQWWYWWAHPTKSRWASMMPAVYGLADELNKTNQKELFSIVSYSTAHSLSYYDHNTRVKRAHYALSETEAQPTRDYQSAVQQLDHKYKYEKPISGGTNISAGIDQAVNVLTSASARPNAFKTVIVMTDGQQNSGRASWDAAADAAGHGIDVHTVTFGHTADQSSMRRTAAAGNGKHFHAPTGNALEEVFREIANMPPSALIE